MYHDIILLKMQDVLDKYKYKVEAFPPKSFSCYAYCLFVLQVSFFSYFFLEGVFIFQIGHFFQFNGNPWLSVDNWE